ncbi:hypothetical protein BP5796_07425 [Coleophoma crateriformis]|uniref:RNB domain-containing protein n=1 Tax=Coleophoma crateriformis TaxID=565419 RepID=A0A3D8RIV8_9HELO|nr:hypothetical protein BP5796_07425 [Coleophoma crateriformis]
MLRIPRLKPVESFVSRSCLARLPSGVPTAPNFRHTRSLNAAANEPQISQITAFGNVTAAKPKKRNTIREQLSFWESENAQTSEPALDPANLASPGSIRNNLTRLTDGIETVIADQQWDTSITESHGGQEDRLNVGDRRSFLLAGDLVDLGGRGSQQSELAIFIQEYENQAQYYTMSGRWMHKFSKDVGFFVPGFASKAEVDELRPYLPQTEVSAEMQDKLHAFDRSVPRTVGGGLVQNMVKFMADADTIYQTAAFKLDTAHRHMAFERIYRYVTLEDIADALLQGTVKKSKNGRYSQPALYAVHRAIVSNEIGFQFQMRGDHKKGGRYEVAPLREVSNVYAVAEDVRLFVQGKISKEKVAAKGKHLNFLKFVNKAQKMIDRSRASRSLTPYGMVGPFSKNSEDSEQSVALDTEEDFDESDGQYIMFLESWAALRSFSLTSAFNGTGSNILRALDRYNDQMNLNQTTAWVCLQEIGVIPPWEDPAAYLLRLPKTGRRLRTAREGQGQHVWREDTLKNLRESFDAPVYCIDNVNAHEIDDGVSIESTEIADQYWVHIHAADPSCRIDPDSAIARSAKSFAQSIYLPETVTPMIETAYMRANLSLRRGARCLTFSAKMDKDGNILETKIMPRKLKRVMFFTPKVLDEVIQGPSSPQAKNTIRVGPDLPLPPPSRKMLSVEELSEKDQSDLRVLHEIGQAHAAKRASRGGLSTKMSNSMTSVSIDQSLLPSHSGYSSVYAGEPTIDFAADYHDPSSDHTQVETVQNLMLLGGEIAARWCRDRAIPIPYRVTAYNPDLEDPRTYFKNTVLPSLDSHGNVPDDIAMKYFQLCGKVLISSEPGPHMTAGLELYTKCTSPLRRYGDLLVHWQVEAAMLEEARIGESLIGSSREDYLPFKKADLDAMLPDVAIQERLSRIGMRYAQRAWFCQLLVRAWHFKETPLPKTFEFVVRYKTPQGEAGGILPFFLQNCVCRTVEKDIGEEVSIGDRLEVELKHVDVYEGHVDVRALRWLAPDEKVSTERV